jgi:hypothetical protein
LSVCLETRFGSSGVAVPENSVVLFVVLGIVHGICSEKVVDFAVGVGFHTFQAQGKKEGNAFCHHHG